MIELLSTILAYGPPGGIDSGVAVKWVIIWTLILGGSLYASLFFPQWVTDDDESH